MMLFAKEVEFLVQQSFLEKHNEYLSFLNKKQELQEKRNLITKSFKDSTDTEKIKKQVQEIKKKLMRYLCLQKKYMKNFTMSYY